jgi:TonB family protein
MLSFVPIAHGFTRLTKEDHAGQHAPRHTSTVRNPRMSSPFRSSFPASTLVLLSLLASSSQPAIAQNMSKCIAIRDAAGGGREFYNTCAGTPVTLFWCERGPGRDCATFTDRNINFGSSSRQSIGRGPIEYGACNGVDANVRYRGLDFDCLPAQSAPSQVQVRGLKLLSCPNLADFYPPASMRAEEQGVVIVRVYVTESGVVNEASVDKTSGFPRLDEATLPLARACRFQPARDATGKPAGTWASLPFRWTLNE